MSSSVILALELEPELEVAWLGWLEAAAELLAASKAAARLSRTVVDGGTPVVDGGTPVVDVVLEVSVGKVAVVVVEELVVVEGAGCVEVVEETGRVVEVVVVVD